MNLTLNISEETLSTFRQTPLEFSNELRLAACIKWYELGRLSQAKAAEVASLSRADFIDALRRYQVPAVQSTSLDLEKELAG